MLLAFRQMLGLRLTDVRDGRLYLPDRVVPLAEPVRTRLSAYPDYRRKTWPEAIRQDRILDGTHATGGDVRQLCELFGLSIAGAYRYTSTVDHPGIAEDEESTPD